MAKMVIDGALSDSSNAGTFNVINPATGDVVDTAPNASLDDVRRAIDSAEDAFKIWSETPVHVRARTLIKSSQIIRENRDELATLLTKEQGKPFFESKFEIGILSRLLEYYGGQGGRISGSYLPPVEKGRHHLVIKKPVGICGAIVPWNFPVLLMGYKIAPALIAGCTMIVKPASTTPLTDLRCVELINNAGVPKGVLNIVTGPGSIVGQELVENPKINKISFTGETKTGKQIMETSAANVKRITLELGGSDPMIVCDDADLDKALSAALWGRFLNCGQACIAVKRLFLFEKIAPIFKQKYVELVKTIKIGNGLEKGITMGPLNNPSQRESVESMVSEAVSSGAEILTGGSRPEGAEFDKGNFYLPTLLSNVSPDSRITTEECFGPALPIFVVKDLEEAVSRANDTIYGLGSSIWTKDINKVTYAMDKIEAGTVWVNMPFEVNVDVPFGGIKQSGLGRELGIEGLEAYLESRAIYIGSS